VYTRSMETIYLSLRSQVAVGTFFLKSPVALAHNFITLTHLNSTAKLHRLHFPRYFNLFYYRKLYCILKSYWLYIFWPKPYARRIKKEKGGGMLWYKGKICEPSVPNNNFPMAVNNLPFPGVIWGVDTISPKYYKIFSVEMKVINFCFKRIIKRFVAV